MKTSITKKQCGLSNSKEVDAILASKNSNLIFQEECLQRVVSRKCTTSVLSSSPKYANEHHHRNNEKCKKNYAERNRTNVHNTGRTKPS
uniref:Ovule protein n=1 Tax=Parascaris univalens TaxID=6257 RepID=A0A915A266_PARUN